MRILSILIAGLIGVSPIATSAEPGFVLLAPDRGFLGNEEMRDAFEAFQSDVPASVLAFATAERTEENLTEAIRSLTEAHPSISELVVLPFFVTSHNALLQRARTALKQQQLPVRIGEVFGDSYLAEEILFDRVRALLPEGHEQGGHSGHGGHESHGSHGAASAHDPLHGTPRLVVVGSGAGTSEDAEAIAEKLQAMAARAVHKFGLAEARVAVLYDWSAPADVRDSGFTSLAEATRQASVHGEALVVPFNLAPRLTTMMADWTRVQRELGPIQGVRSDGLGIVPHPNVVRWMVREANRHLPMAANEVGIILVPHGSDYNWNEAMRAAMAPVRDRYVTEDAFSMVDPFVVERAVRRLEKRGVKAAVLVRIFSLESSFQHQAEYVLGLRADYRGPHAERISSHLRFATVGGMEAHELLADAMVDRALEISQDPSRETVVLVAHGTGGDAQNEHWMRNLESIARYIKAKKPAFRDVTFHTWREDWPDKREASISAIRKMVEEAGQDGGTALVVPVRTIDRGPEADFLQGLTYRHGQGFAPHPNFVRWLEEMIAAGIAQLRDDSAIARVETKEDKGMSAR